MPAVAVKEPYTLVLRRDEGAESPRETNDNFGKMICFHSRYALGDEHDFDSPDTFLRRLVLDSVSAKDICDFTLSGKPEHVKLTPEPEDGAYCLKALYFTEWDVIDRFNPLAEHEEAAADLIVDYMDEDSLLRLAETANIILPLYLLDHSGLSMSTADFQDRWDSGQVGWIYAGKKEAAAALQIPQEQVESKAAELLKAEVTEYDSYLRGECYGFQLYEKGVDVDSCWGFIGRPEAIQSAVEAYLPDGCKGMMDSLKYLDSDAEVDKILLEQEHENEYTEGDYDLSATELSMEARAFPFAEPKGNQLGFASVTLNGGFALTGIKIMQGQNGPFVAMPSTKDREGNFRDIFFPVTKEARAELNATVMGAHNKAIEAMLSSRADAREDRPSATGKLEAAKQEAAKAPKKTKTAPAKGKGGEAI